MHKGLISSESLQRMKYLKSCSPKGNLSDIIYYYLYTLSK